MTVADLWFVARYGPLVPYFDDWEIVPVLVGQQPLTAAWLWSAHNEHRLPLPRLLLLGLCHVGGFQAGMFYNAAALSGLALAMIVVARRVRGRTSLADAVFPLALLHYGHFENLLWSWQVGFVTSTVLAGAVLVGIAMHGQRPTFGAVVGIGVCLVLLPLCGANGLILALPPAVWLGVCGLIDVFRAGEVRRHEGWRMLAFAVAFAIVASAYVLGMRRPPHQPYDLSPRDVLANAQWLVRFPFGMIVEGLWRRQIETVLLLLTFTLALLARVCWQGGSEARRAAGILAVMAGVAGVGLAVATGRPGHGGAPRYITLVVLALLAAVWAVILYSRQAERRDLALWVLLIVATLAAPDVTGVVCLVYFGLLLFRLITPTAWGQSLAALLAAVLLVANTMTGLDYGRLHRSVSDHFERDVYAGRTPRDLAARYSHGPAQLFPSETALASYLTMLHDAGLPPFPALPPTPADK